MADAATKDKSESSPNVLNKLKMKLRTREELQVTLVSSHTIYDANTVVEEPPMTVEFLVHRSLLDYSPTIVKRKPAHQYGFRY